MDLFNFFPHLKSSSLPRQRKKVKFVREAVTKMLVEIEQRKSERWTKVHTWNGNRNGKDIKYDKVINSMSCQHCDWMDL